MFVLFEYLILKFGLFFYRYVADLFLGHQVRKLEKQLKVIRIKYSF